MQITTLMGRIADRSDSGILGCQYLAEAIAERMGIQVKTIGEPSASKQDNWQAALLEAKVTLELLQSEIKLIINGNERYLGSYSNCAASIASLPPIMKANPNTKLIWFDAHADFNTPNTTNSQFLGGIALSSILGLWESGYGGCMRSEDVLIVGARDIDPEESSLLQLHNLKVLPPSEELSKQLSEWCKGNSVFVHLDWDVTEPDFLPTPYKVPNGLRPFELRKCLEAICRHSSKIVGFESTEFGLGLDKDEAEFARHIALWVLEPLLT
jgi:arginase